MTHKLGIVSIIAVLSALVMTSFVSVVTRADTTAEWTVLVYLDGDNNLDTDSAADIGEMMMVGSTENVNVLVLWDRYSEPAYLYKVLEGGLELVEGMTVNGIPVNGQEISMADWRVLEAFVDFGKAEMPAEHYMLDLWDHGNAFGYTCWDDHWLPPWEPPGRAISLGQMVDALEGTGNVDILAYDGCTIGMVEIAYELSLIPPEKGVQIGYLVASEEYIPLNGYPYHQILAQMNSMADMSDVEAVARMLADEYAACYSAHGDAKGTSTVGLSVIDLTMMGPIVPGLETLTGVLMEGLAEDFDYYHDLIAEARGGGNLPWSLNGWDQRVDIGAFLLSLATMSEDEEVKMLAEEIFGVIADAVYVGNTPALADTSAYGLGVWFPVSYKTLGNANAGYSLLDRYMVEFAFPEDAGWMDFLYAFWGKAPKA